MRHILLRPIVLLAILILATGFGLGCGGGGGGGGGGHAKINRVVPAQNVVVIDQMPDLLLANTTDGVYTFEHPISSAGVFPLASLPGDTVEISPNQIIVGSEGSGYLRKVTTVSDDGVELQVGTTAVTMEEAFEELDVEYTQTFETVDVQSAQAMSPGVTLQPVGMQPLGIQPALFDRFYVQVTNVVLYSSGGKSVTVNGYIEMKPDFVFQAKIKNFKLKSLKTTITLNETVNLSVNANMDLVSFEREKELAQYKMKPITIWAGMVPIVLYPTLSLVVGVEGNLSTGIETSVTVGSTLTAGLQYQNGAFSPIYGFTKTFEYLPPTAYTTCTVKGYAGPQLLVRVYGVVGPYITTAGYLQFDANPAETPWWKLTAGIFVEAGVKIKVLGRVLANYGVEIFRYERSLANSSGATPEDNFPPTTSLSLMVVPVGPSQIDLSWLPATDDVGVVEYRIYRGSVMAGTATVTNFSDTGLAANTQYCYTVRAVDASGKISDPGIYPWCAVTPPLDAIAPSAPSALAITADSPTSLWLSWTASTDNVMVTGYRVYQGAGEVGSVSSSGLAVTGLDPVTQYCFTIKALDAEGNLSPASAEQCATTLVAADAVVPSAPGGLSPSPVNSSRIDLSWTASTDNVRVAGYLVFDSVGQIGSTPTNSFSARELSPGTLYCFTVKAYDPAGNLSGASTQQCATTPATTPDGTPPSVPTNLTVVPAGIDQINVTWTAGTDNVGVSGYQVYRGEELAGSPAATVFSDINLFPDTEYCYRVKAVDAAGNVSKAGARVCASTTAAP